MSDRHIAKLHIGKLAEQLGLNPKTIRYYEQIGLLPAPARNTAGYRLYGQSDQDRLLFIIQAKTIGLTLHEIGEILALRDGGQRPCAHVVELIDQKLLAIEAQLQALRDAQQGLLALREDATIVPSTCAVVCGIIEHHNTSSAAR
ncbi:heavy metal-responsive transcriptional regulator [soil metagenome]